MTERTLTALYATKDAAEQAKAQLKSAGVDDIDIHQEGDAAQAGGQAAGQAPGLLDKIASFFGGHEDHHAYAEGVRRGHYLLTAKVGDDHAEQAATLLESSGAVDFDAAQEGWRGEGWTGGLSTGAVGAAGYTAAIDAPTAGVETRGAAVAEPLAGQDGVIQVVQEQLKVGKREVERGGVRVRSYVVEEPVREQVNLREEHVSIERRPVDRPIADASALLQDRTLELTETAEEAVVAKEAVVKEEIGLRKDVSERTEQIADTVRHTEVEVVDDRTGRVVPVDPTVAGTPR